jgi:hypothetical protein
MSETSPDYPPANKVHPVIVVTTAQPKPPAKKIMKDWNFNAPDNRLTPLLLLTIRGIAVYAVWHGVTGEHYVAWAEPDSVPACGHLH